MTLSLHGWIIKVPQYVMFVLLHILVLSKSWGGIQDVKHLSFFLDLCWYLFTDVFIKCASLVRLARLDDQCQNGFWLKWTTDMQTWLWRPLIKKKKKCCHGHDWNGQKAWLLSPLEQEFCLTILKWGVGSRNETNVRAVSSNATV